MDIKFGVFFTKSLGTLYKDNSVTVLGKEASVDIDLKEVSSIYANYKVGENSFTDLVDIVDINKGLIRIPFKSDVLKVGVNRLELVATMKNGEVLPSQTFTYTVDKSLENPNSVEAETNYPILIELLKEVDNSIKKLDTHWEKKEVEIDEKFKVIDESLKEIVDAEAILNNALEDLKGYKDTTTNELDNDLSQYKTNTTIELKEDFNRYSSEATLNLVEELDSKFTAKSEEITKTLNDEIDKVNASLNSKINEVDEIVEEVELSEQVRKEEHEELINELSAYADDINNVKDKFNDFEDRIDTLEAKITDNEVIVDLKSKVNEHEARLDILEEGAIHNSRIDNLENKVNALEPKVSKNEKDIKNQGVLIDALFDLTETISITEEGNAISLPQSKEGTIIIDELQGNTLVNYCTNGSEELTLNNEINTQGYNAIIKPSTQYTVAFDSDKAGEVNIGLGGAKTSTTNGIATITTPSTLTDDSLRLYGEGIKVSNVRLLEGDKTNCVPSYFEGMQSCFEDKEQDNGSYKIEIISSNSNNNKSDKIQLSSIEPLRKWDRFVFKDNKLIIERNCRTYILNGSENFQVYRNETNFKTISLYTKVLTDALISSAWGENICLSDKFATEKFQTTYIGTDIPKISISNSGHGIVLTINKSDLPTVDSDGLKQWLTENPVMVVYQLAEPTYEEVPYETQKRILECYENGTLFIDTLIPPTVSVTYSANKPVVAKLNQVDNTTNVNTEEIAITQMAVDFLLMSSLGEEMINFKIKRGTNMSAYFASRIIKGALKYEDVISKYPNYKEDIDLILIAEGYSDLIVEL